MELVIFSFKPTFVVFMRPSVSKASQMSHFTHSSQTQSFCTLFEMFSKMSGFRFELKSAVLMSDRRQNPLNHSLNRLLLMPGRFQKSLLNLLLKLLLKHRSRRDCGKRPFFKKIVNLVGALGCRLSLRSWHG